MTDTPVHTSSASAANWEVQVDLTGLRMPRRIGVCINYGAHIWYQLQREHEQQLGTELGIEVEVVDAGMDVALQARQVADFRQQGVDALIYSAVDPAQAPAMLEPFQAAEVPVITESVWVDSPAVAANVMINDFQGGVKIGRLAAARIQAEGLTTLKVLDVTAPWLAEGLQRSDGFLAGLREGVPNVVTRRLDGRADIKTSAAVVAEVLREDPSFHCIFGVDDESAIGARQAYEQLQLPLDRVLISSFGFSGQQAYDWLVQGVYQIVCAMFPEYQARMLIHAAIFACNHLALPLHLVGPCVALTAETLPQYYTLTPTGPLLNLAAVRSISTEGESLI